jgi:hypothetical protein
MHGRLPSAARGAAGSWLASPPMHPHSSGPATALGPPARVQGLMARWFGGFFTATPWGGRRVVDLGFSAGPAAAAVGVPVWVLACSDWWAGGE